MYLYTRTNCIGSYVIITIFAYTFIIDISCKGMGTPITIITCSFTLIALMLTFSTHSIISILKIFAFT